MNTNIGILDPKRLLCNFQKRVDYISQIYTSNSTYSEIRLDYSILYYLSNFAPAVTDPVIHPIYFYRILADTATILMLYVEKTGPSTLPTISFIETWKIKYRQTYYPFT